MINDLYKNPIANPILTGETESSSPKISNTTRMFIWPFLFNIVLKVRGYSNQRRKKVKGIHIGKEEIKPSLFADDIDERS